MGREITAGTDVRAVLAARAQVLAEPVERRTQALWLHIVVKLGAQRLAIAATRAQHVAALGTVTPVPSPVSAVVGMVPVHGKIVAAVDLATLLGIAPEKPVLDRDIVVIDDGGDGVALLVDEVDGLTELEDGSPDGPGPAMGELTQTGPWDLRVLHVDAVLASLRELSPLPSPDAPTGGNP